MKINKSQYSSLGQSGVENSTVLHRKNITTLLVGSLLLWNGVSYANETEDMYKGSWSNYGMAGTKGSGVGTQAILTNTEDRWSIWYRWESMGNYGDNHTIAWAIHIGEHYILVPTHARTSTKIDAWNIIENNSHVEIHRIEEWKRIDHITASLWYGKSSGSGKWEKEFIGETWGSIALSAWGNLNIWNNHGYVYGTIGKEYITQPHNQAIGFGAVEYHSGKVRTSLFATENRLREYKFEYWNGGGWMGWISHTEWYISETRAYIGYTFGFGWTNHAHHEHHLDTGALMKQTLFATDITNTQSLAGTKGEFEDSEAKHDHKE